MDRAGLCAALVSAVLVVGCGNGEVLGPDARDGDGDSGVPGTPDARQGDVSALELEFRTDPEIPKDDLGAPWQASLTKATFRIEDLRVVGDAAILEDPELELEFTERQHIIQRFSPAAPGMYSTFIGRIDHYRIEGTVDIGAGDQDFRIDDNPDASTTFVVLLGNVSVGAGETVKLRIDIELEDFVNEIDWANAELDDDKLVPEDEEELSEEIAEAFVLH